MSSLAADRPLGGRAQAVTGRGDLVLATSLDGGSLCQSPGRSASGWPVCALPSTPGSKKSASALASWCWPGRPPSPAAPQRPRSSWHRAGHRQRCTGRWLARRGRLRLPCWCTRRRLRRGHPSRGTPRLQHAAPARPTGQATPPTPPPPGRAPTTRAAGASGRWGTGIPSPGVAGGTTPTAPGMATARGTTVRADGITAAGRTPSAGIAPATAIGKATTAQQEHKGVHRPHSVRPAAPGTPPTVRRRTVPCRTCPVLPNSARWMSVCSCGHSHGYSRSEGADLRP